MEPLDLSKTTLTDKKSGDRYTMQEESGISHKAAWTILYTAQAGEIDSSSFDDLETFSQISIELNKELTFSESSIDFVNDFINTYSKKELKIKFPFLSRVFENAMKKLYEVPITLEYLILCTTKEPAVDHRKFVQFVPDKKDKKLPDTSKLSAGILYVHEFRVFCKTFSIMENIPWKKDINRWLYGFFDAK